MWNSVKNDNRDKPVTKPFHTKQKGQQEEYRNANKFKFSQLSRNF